MAENTTSYIADMACVRQLSFRAARSAVRATQLTAEVRSVRKAKYVRLPTQVWM